jgi:hypothetical protein
VKRPTFLACWLVVCLFCATDLHAEQTDSASPDPHPSASSASFEKVPQLVRFSGVLRDLAGQPLTGTADVHFAIYKDQTDTEAIWQETQTLQLDGQGRYSVLLGVTQPEGLPLLLFQSTEARWLGVSAGKLPEQPRVVLVSVPYALKASDSDTLGGLPASAYALAGSQALLAPVTNVSSSAPSSALAPPGAQTAQLTPLQLAAPTACRQVSSHGTVNYVAKFAPTCELGNSLVFDNGTNVGVGTSTPVAFLDEQSTFTATRASPNFGLRALTTVNPAAASSASTFALFANAMTPRGNTQNITNLYGFDYRTDHYGMGTLTGAYGGYGAVLNHSTGTISDAYGLVTYLQNASTGTIGTGYGLYVDQPLNSGGGTFSNYYGVYIGNPSAVTGAYGLYSAGGQNYFGGAVGIGTTTPGANLEVNGTSQFDGAITFASGQTFPIPVAGVTDAMLANPYSGVGTCASGTVVTGLARNAAPTCTALTGTATFSGSNSSQIVSVTQNGSGMALLATNTTNSAYAHLASSETAPYFFAPPLVTGVYGNGSGVGVYGQSQYLGVLGIGADGGAGVYGYDPSSWAGYFNGNVDISGTVSKSSGSFKIDHPLDPANKYLFHSFVESPDMMNVYNGVVRLDAHGEAWVDLPDYFEVLNRDFRYQLTPIGAPAPNLYVASEVSGNRFKIAGGTPGGKVSWQVTGIRQDAFANAHRIQVEVEKAANERGYYIHPELYGAPPERSIEWARHPKLMQHLKAERGKAVASGQPH